jgi:septal ring factor EnvC (AmiA/AmiB activator)
MLKSMSLAAALSLMAAMPAFAESACGDEPIAPAIPTAAEIGQKAPADAAKAKHQAFEDIKSWQQSANDYRNCLDADANQLKRQLASQQSQTKPDQDRIKDLQTRIATDERLSNSRDTEERLVNAFHALTTAYCSRSDTDKSSCPKS